MPILKAAVKICELIKLDRGTYNNGIRILHYGMKFYLKINLVRYHPSNSPNKIWLGNRYREREGEKGGTDLS